jgi:hypothetical protein
VNRATQQFAIALPVVATGRTCVRHCVYDLAAQRASQEARTHLANGAALSRVCEAGCFDADSGPDVDVEHGVHDERKLMVACFKERVQMDDTRDDEMDWGLESTR